MNDPVIQQNALFIDWYQRIEKTLTQLLTQPHSPITAAMRYSVLNGGKRLRPLLVYATGQTLQAELDQLDLVAAAIELIHCYSLVHDDLPAMDNDDLRRGKPTCHKAYDEATAILVGDALQSLAFQVLCDVSAQSDSRKLQMIQVLSHACGGSGMVAGQYLDLRAEQQTLPIKELERLHALKTGALFNACVQMGALCAPQCDANTWFQLQQFAHHIGLAFQIKDDLLDVESTTQQLGKTSGSDASHCKSTYVSLLGLPKARQQLAHHTKQALQALHCATTDMSLLITLTHCMIERCR